nr:ATP/GTP-binding protein [Streptomyces oceani]
MSPRRNRPPRASDRPLGRADRDTEPGRSYGLERVDEWRGEEWLVRPVGGGAAGKRYRCPGCDQEIPAGVAHVVAWARHGPVDDRRHWHTSCWNARERRGARVRRSRDAPRY